MISSCHETFPALEQKYEAKLSRYDLAFAVEFLYGRFVIWLWGK